MQVSIKFSGSFHSFLSSNASIRARVIEKTGLNENNVKIMKNGQILDFDQIKNYNENNPSFAILIKRQLINIKCAFTDGRVIHVALTETKKINDVKIFIEKNVKVPFNNIRLEYNYRIVRGDDGLVECFGDDREPSVVVREMAKDEIMVYVTCHRPGYDDETVRIDARLSEDVRSLKGRINEKCSFGIGLDGLRLVYRTMMEDGYNIRTYGIEDGSRLEAYDGEWIAICIVVKGGKRHYCLQVHTSDTVRMVIDKLSVKMNVDASDILLSRDGTFLFVDKPLYYYDIGNNDSIEALLKFRGGGICYNTEILTLRRPNGDTFTVKGCMGLIDLQSLMETREGYARERYEMMVDGELLADGVFKCICKYKDKIIDIVALKRVQFRIIENDAFVDVHLESNMRVMDVKTMVCDEIGLKEEIQQLWYDGAPLNDNDTILSLQRKRSGIIVDGGRCVECKLLIEDEV